MALRKAGNEALVSSTNTKSLSGMAGELSEQQRDMYDLWTSLTVAT
jgi:hypothetical protein